MGFFYSFFREGRDNGNLIFLNSKHVFLNQQHPYLGMQKICFIIYVVNASKIVISNCHGVTNFINKSPDVVGHIVTTFRRTISLVLWLNNP